MITKIEVRNVQGALMTLLLEDVSSGFIIKDIRGLGPVKASIITSPFALVDGVQYQASRREARNLVLVLDLEPDYVSNTVRALRTQLYNFFMTESTVNLKLFLADGLTVDISAKVETCEPSYFEQQPSVEISLICPDPDFLGVTPVSVAGNTTSGTTETLVTNPGTVDSGILFTMNVNRTVSAFDISNRMPDNSVQGFNFSYPMVSGDILTISTFPGNKYIKILRSGVSTDILYSKTAASIWPFMAPGNSYFKVFAVGAAIPWTIGFSPRYGGL